MDWNAVAQKTKELVPEIKKLEIPVGWDVDIWFENFPPRIHVFAGKLCTNHRRAENSKGYIEKYTDGELAELTSLTTEIAKLGLNGCSSFITDGTVRYKFWIKNDK